MPLKIILVSRDSDYIRFRKILGSIARIPYFSFVYTFFPKIFFKKLVQNHVAFEIFLGDIKCSVSKFSTRSCFSHLQMFLLIKKLSVVSQTIIMTAALYFSAIVLEVLSFVDFRVQKMRLCYRLLLKVYLGLIFIRNPIFYISWKSCLGIGA